jgi:hypothetical protein
LNQQPAGDTRPFSAAPLYRVVYDERFPASVEFGRAAARRGELVRIEGDISDFWFADLSHEWQRRPAPIAGLTARGPLFFLERLAWDHCMRVVFRGEHRCDGYRVLHSVSGSSPAIDTVDCLALASPRWAHHVARAVTSCGPNTPSRGTYQLTVSGACKYGTKEPLFSWVIARPVPLALSAQFDF